MLINYVKRNNFLIDINTKNKNENFPLLKAVKKKVLFLSYCTLKKQIIIKAI